MGATNLNKRNGRLAELVKAGEVKKHSRKRAPKGRNPTSKLPFRTFKLKPGIRIEKAAKSGL